MTSLMDIASLTRQVPVGDIQVEMAGLSATGLAHLLVEFPELQAMMNGKDVDLTPQRLIELVPESVAGIIAAGTGHPGKPDWVKKAASLPVGVQLDLLMAVLDLSIPGGLGPFVQKLAVLASAVGLDLTDISGKALDTK